MTEQEIALAEELARAARSLFARGYSFGTAGNLSAKCGQHVLISPTNSSFADLSSGRFGLIDMQGTRLSGPAPSKEAHFHLAVYDVRPEVTAVIHLHSTYATAVSCLRHEDPENALPVFTPYFAMRIPCLPVVPYLRPGHPGLADEVRKAARLSPAMLLKNHGPIVAGRTVSAASALAEELEEQSKLFFLLHGRGDVLSAAQVAELRGGMPRP